MTDWEAHYQRSETPWDKGGPSPGLVDFLAQRPLHGVVLVPGCGTGHDVRAISAAAPDAQVVGLDIAPSAVEAARALSPTGSECYVAADLFALPEDLRSHFDWVWEHTCFCAIDPSLREAYARSVAAALKPGGQFLAIFYLDPGQASPEEGPPFEVSKAQLDALFSPFFELREEWLPTRAYPGRENREWMRLLVRR